MKMTVVVPVRNEVDNILPLVGEINAALDGYLNYEIIYVDDGSTDGTGQLLSDLCEKLPHLRVITHRASYGQSAAIRSGVRAANAPWVATLDGDGQNDPADIRGLWHVIEDPNRPPNLWMVAGHRRDRRDSWLKRHSSKIANGVRRRLLHDGTPDTGCGIKVFSRDAFFELPYFDHMHRFLPALMQRAGGRIISVAVSHRPRTRGRSKYGVQNRLWVGIVDLIGVMWLQRRSRAPVEIEECLT